MIESYSHATFYCDGPDCEVEQEDDDYDPLTGPDGWIIIDGPSSNLGRFHFHSGLCYDNWRSNLNKHLTSLKEKKNG